MKPGDAEKQKRRKVKKAGTSKAHVRDPVPRDLFTPPVCDTADSFVNILACQDEELRVEMTPNSAHNAIFSHEGFAFLSCFESARINAESLVEP